MAKPACPRPPPSDDGERTLEPRATSSVVAEPSPPLRAGTDTATYLVPNVITVRHWDRLLDGEVLATEPRVDWQTLMRRTFGLDLETCDRCGGRMRLVSLITEPDSIVRYLTHIGEPTEPPPLGPARGPPYYQSRVLRRRPSPPQQDLFDA